MPSCNIIAMAIAFSETVRSDDTAYLNYLFLVTLRVSPAGCRKLKQLLSFAIGGLLGDVFLHLLPEAWAHSHSCSPGGSTFSLRHPPVLSILIPPGDILNCLCLFLPTIIPLLTLHTDQWNACVLRLAYHVSDMSAIL